MKVVSGFYQPRTERKRVTCYEKYEVDNLGRVFSEGFEMSLIDGGKYVNLCKNGEVTKYKVAYLVARAFIPNMEMRPFVRHKDGNSSNNKAENLEWCEEQEKRKVREGVTRQRRVMCVTDAGDCIEFESVTKAAEEMMVSRAGILKCISGKQNKCGGLKWYEI